MTILRKNTSISTLFPLGILAFYALNIDTILGMIKINTMVYQIVVFGLTVVVGVKIRFIGQFRKNMSEYNGILYWIFLLIIVSILSAFFSESPEYVFYGLRILISTMVTVLNVPIALAFFSPGQEEASQSRIFFILIFLAAFLSIILDPLLDFRSRFPSVMSQEYEASRAGGVYFQPNQAAFSLVMIYALLVPRLRQNFMLVATFVLLVGVFITFSRSGLLLAMIVIIASVARGYVNRSAIFLILLTLILYMAGTFLQDVIALVFDIDRGSGYARLFDYQRFYELSAIRDENRYILAQYALDDVLSGKFFGNGIGYSWEWADRQVMFQGTHNIYLRYMLEYGYLGALIWPAFVYVVFKARNNDIDRFWALGLAAAAIVAGFFSHNLPEQGSILVIYMAALMLPVPADMRLGRRARQQ